MAEELKFTEYVVSNVASLSSFSPQFLDLALVIIEVSIDDVLVFVLNDISSDVFRTSILVINSS